MHPPILIIAALFYLLLVIGAVIRIRKSRSLSTYLQILGVFLPVLPILAILLFGFSLSLMIVYACLWLLMGIGYILEGLSEKRAPEPIVSHDSGTAVS